MWIGIGVSIYIWMLTLGLLMAFVWNSVQGTWKARPKPFLTEWILGNAWVPLIILAILGTAWIWAGWRNREEKMIQWLAMASIIIGSLVLATAILAMAIPFIPVFD